MGPTYTPIAGTTHSPMSIILDLPQKRALQLKAISMENTSLIVTAKDTGIVKEEAILQPIQRSMQDLV